jgi:hypothetical protein
MTVDLKANEVVVKATDSEYFGDNEKISGKLILTNQRLYFKTLQEEENRYNMEIMPNEIHEVIPFNTSFFSKNGLNLVTKTGNHYKFLMKKRDTWGVIINKIY